MRKFFPAIALLLALGLSVPVLAGPLEEVLAIYNFGSSGSRVGDLGNFRSPAACM